MPQLQGTVARWVPERGFGFIKPDGASGSSQDLFVHWSDCGAAAKALPHGVSHLPAGTKVAFDISTDPSTKKRKASGVRILGDTAAPSHGRAPQSGPSTPSGTQGSAPGKTIFFKATGRVAGVALFILRTHNGVEEVLLCHNPPRGGWESSGFFSEPAEKCFFDDFKGAGEDCPAGGDAATFATDLLTDNPTSRSVAQLRQLLGLPDVASLPHISVFTSPSGATCFQSVYVALPDDVPLAVSTEGAGWARDAGEQGVEGQGHGGGCGASAGGGGGGGGAAPGDDPSAVALSYRYDTLRWFDVKEVTGKTSGEKILQHTEQRVHFSGVNRKVRSALGL